MTDLIGTLIPRIGNQLTVGQSGGQLVAGGGSLFNPGAAVKISQPIGGGSAVVKTAGQGAVQIKTNVVPAIPQTDKLPIDTFAGATMVVDLGEVDAFIDMDGVAAPSIAIGDVVMVTPDGSLHDLAVLTTFRDGFQQGLPFTLPPGRYQFLVKAGVTGANIFVQHVGAKNLI